MLVLGLTQVVTARTDRPIRGFLAPPGALRTGNTVIGSNVRGLAWPHIGVHSAQSYRHVAGAGDSYQITSPQAAKRYVAQRAYAEPGVTRPPQAEITAPKYA
ncbi:hypothetical protein CVT26_002159 [Gymnopilus dilepis]|uniref:Uncharacterized protein n=1 Tax=Gymnopilus dilepis TaxID=231916 RepID=A0A409YN05_9AGAR|nr:hypothetical protein CVT26_002159 [Gymnopilus dilepis]